MRNLSNENYTDGWFTPLRFSFLLAFTIIAVFSEVLIGTKTFYFGDFGQFGYSVAHYFRESFWHGSIPLWNPLSNCGLPFLAQWNTQTLYPPSLFYLIFPLSWGLGVFCLLHLFWAGMGMYFFAYHRTGNRLAASVAGLVFAFNGLIWQSIEWPAAVSSLAWMPWVVLTAEQAWTNGGQRIVLAGITGALQMLSGTPEIIILTWGTVAAFWFVRFVNRDVPRQRLLCRCLLVMICVAGLSAAQILPFLDLLAHSQRDTNYGTSMNSLPVTGWANFVVPLFHLYRPWSAEYPVQHEQKFFSSYYIGIGTIAFALIAGWRIRTREVWILLCLTLSSVILAMGDHGLAYSCLKWAMPLVGFVRYPVKFVMLSIFTIPLLAAYGIKWLRSFEDSDNDVTRKTLYVTIMVVLGLIAGVGWIEWKLPESMDNVPLILENAVVRGIFLAAIVGCFYVLPRLSERRDILLLKIWLLLLLWLDVFTHISPLAPTVSRGVYQMETFQEHFAWAVPLHAGQARALDILSGTEAYSFPETAVQYVLKRRFALSGNFNLLDDVPKANGFFSLYLLEMSDINIFLNWASDGPSPLCDFLGICRIRSSQNPTEWILREKYMPMLTAGQAPLFLDASNTLQNVTVGNNDLQRFVFLPLDAKSHVVTIGSPDAKVISSHFTAQRITVEVDSTTPAMLVIAQAYYHNWHAYEDGKPVSLWRANYAFQALEFPAGRHHIELVYKDRLFLLGTAISILSLLTCVTGRFLTRKLF